MSCVCWRERERNALFENILIIMLVDMWVDMLAINIDLGGYQWSLIINLIGDPSDFHKSVCKGIRS